MGQVAGAIALMLAVLHFAFGPIEPKRPLDQVAAEKAVSIRESVTAAIKGQRPPVAPPSERRRFDADSIVVGASSAIGGLAAILGVVGFARRETWRACAAAAGLGLAAIAFHITLIVVGAIIVILLLGTILSSLGLG